MSSPSAALVSATTLTANLAKLLGDAATPDAKLSGPMRAAGEGSLQVEQ
jgi:hypothetical protein